MKVVATNPIFSETRAIFPDAATVIAPEGPEPLSGAALAAELRDADAMMAFMTDRVDAALLSGAPRLRVIGAALKGHDNIDVAAAAKAGVCVTIVPDLLTVPTAELAIGLILALGRQILPADASVRSGFNGWRARFYGVGLAGATVGIVGFGAVGRAIAARLSGFDARVLAVDPAGVDGPGVEPAAFEDLLARADVVVLATPLTAATRGLIGAAALAAMKPGALLINPARGSVVDEAAVADALESGRLGGYAADVHPCEDLSLSDAPTGIEPRLLADGVRTVLTPHIGSAVLAARRAIERSAAENILAALDGRRPPDAVDRPDPVR